VAMAAEERSIVCGLCNKGRLVGSLKGLELRQWSKKGYIYFHVVLPVRVCDSCGAKSLGPGAELIMDEAFQIEYDKLP